MEQKNLENLNLFTQHLSEQTSQDFIDFLSNGETPFYLMQNGTDIKKVVTRFQTTTNLKSFGAPKKVEDLQTGSYYKPVLSNVPAYSKDGKFTPFALMMNPAQIGKVKYPIISFLTNQNKVTQDRQLCSNYEAVKNALCSAFSIKIVEKAKKEKDYAKDKDSISYLKRKKLKNFIKYNAAKTLKLCKTIFTFGAKKYNGSKLDKTKYGTIYLKQYDRINATQVSQVDKLTSIISKISKRACLLSIKQLKLKKSVTELNKTQFLAQLLTTLYVARANSYGSIEADKKVSDALSLQISNLVATMGSSSDVQKACKASAMATGYILQKMGKTPKDIIEGSIRIGKPLLVESEIPTFQEVMFAKHDPNKIQEKLNSRLSSIQENKNQEPIVQEDSQEKQTTEEAKENIQQVLSQQEKTEEKLKTKKSIKALSRNSANKTFTTALEKALTVLSKKNIGALSKENISKAKLASEDKNNKFIQSFLSFYSISKLNNFDETRIQKQYQLSKKGFSNNLTADDYAKILAKNLIDKKEEFLNVYFDENNLKPCYNFKTNAQLFENFNLGNQGTTLQAKIKDYIQNMMKLTNNKLTKLEKENEAAEKAKLKAEKELLKQTKKASKKSEEPTL